MPFCSVDTLARNTEGAWTVISKKFNLPAGGLRSPAQKVYILHNKLSPSWGFTCKAVQHP